MKRLATEKAVLPHIGGSHAAGFSATWGPSSAAFFSQCGSADDERADAELPADSRLGQQRRTTSYQPRLQWRDNMDKSLKRLMMDMELARDDRLAQVPQKSK